MWSLVAPLLVIGILVFFHELGHFWVAKRSGIRVEAFSIGFGRSIGQFRRGDTVYKIGWIPFGGYVKMSGEDPDDVGDETWRFHKKSVPIRSAVILAGPIANLILAVVIYSLIFMFWGVPVIETTEIGSIAPGTPAEASGLRIGDHIVEVDGVAVSDFEEIVREFYEHPDRSAQVVILRDGGRIQIEIPPVAPDGLIGIGPEGDTRVGNVTPGGPADKIGLLKGDRIVAIEGREIDKWSELRAVMEGLTSSEISVGWLRDGKLHEDRTVVKYVDEKQSDGTVVQVARIQISQYQTLRPLKPLPAIRRGFDQTWFVIENVFAFLKIVFTGQATRDMVGGPVQIFQVSSQQARQGIDNLLNLMAFLSVQLGILNLLPIPVLDGGHIVFLIAEAIRRRPLSITQRAVLQQIGLLVILGLMVTVTVFDVGRLLK